jgi:hypothetical protein
MPPSLEALEKLDIVLPDCVGHHPFGFDQRPKFYKEIADTAEGKTSRTQFFERNLVGLYFALDRPVPYAFRTRNNKVRSMDAGCVKFLCNRRPPDAEVIRDSEGYIIAVRPTKRLLERFGALRTALLNPYAILVRASDLPFDLDEPFDERRRVLAAHVVRDGADLFREAIGAAWGDRCAISKISVPQVLDAAHIYPYRGPATDNLRNAILLRNDLHALFDAFMLSLEYVGDALTVRVSKKLGNTPYAKLEGKTIRLPVDPFHQPADKVVRHHLSKFRDTEQR